MYSTAGRKSIDEIVLENDSRVNCLIISTPLTRFNLIPSQNGMHPCGLQGVPMIAGSPLPNDPSMLCSSSGIDVQRISGDGSSAGGGTSSPMKPDESTPPPPPPPSTSHSHRFSPAGYPPPQGPPSHMFNGMLPPISHVDVKPPQQPNSTSASGSGANGGGHMMLSPSVGDDGSFPPFQQLVRKSH